MNEDSISMPLAETQQVRERPDEIEADARQLITDLRDAARDGRMLADRFAELLKRTVEEYCVEFEQRADSLLARLDQAR
jgi:signal transduction histidine kinase